MAKSLRSRWKRKCRAIKRERYAVKELARLKKMLGIKEEEKVTESEVMESDQVIFLDAGQIGKKKRKNLEKPAEEDPDDVEMSSDDEKIEVEGDNGKKRVFSSKTLKDQNGQYPVWLHKRKIAKINKVGAKKNIKKKAKKRRK
ncbi:protein LLP homolog [Amyelois transitella]|uniref:protein LLP homolog n=1 Tax=Amyelois transitella TaxID=680683 RepID=UPI00067E30AB|nr:protein LLP homolog [Amyelois transitella]